MTFVFPAILAAAAAAVAPVIIHLIMRTKPRKVIFPAMRFVKKTHQANISKLRLKHLILLAMRVAAVLLAVVLVARAQLPAWRGTLASGGPAAVVVVVDNSGSMAYTSAGATCLARGKKLAAEVLAALPPKSRAAVLASAQPAAGADLLADRELVARQIADVPATFGGQSLGAAISRGVDLLARADLKRREMLIVTDCTARAFAEMAPLAGAESIHFTILNVGGGDDLNVGLGDVKLSSGSIPLGAEAAVESSLRSGKVGGDFTVQVELAGEPVAQQTVHLGGAGAAGVSLVVKPQRPGAIHGRLLLANPDPLEMDNTRYFTINAGSQARVLVVRDSTTVGRGDPTSFIMATAVAPPREGGSQTARKIVPSDRLDDEDLAAVDIVMLADVASLSEPQWQRLGGFVRGGGRLWVVAGRQMSPDSYNSPAARAVMPASIKGVEELGAPATFRTDQLNHAMLLPFADADNPPLSQIEVYRRLGIDARASDATVVLQYADGAPAILARPVGEGSSLMWNFSPAPEFSNMASRAQTVVLASQAVAVLTAQTLRQTLYPLGATASVPVPRGFARPVVTLRKPGENDKPIPADLRSRLLSIPCDRLGHWTLEFSEAGRKMSCGFSVNAPAAESDLSPADKAKVETLFPPGGVSFAASAEEISRQESTTTQPLDLLTPFLVGMLVLLTGESFFANRFYKRGNPVLAGPAGSDNASAAASR
jgi:hypothetical protein